MKKSSVLGAAVVASFGAAASAGVTPFSINTGGGGGSEASLRTIFGTVYGGTFNQIGATDNYTNGSVTLTRAQDFLGGAPVGFQNVNGSTLATADDNRWTDGTVTLRFETKYAGNTNTFGWYNNVVNPATFLPLLGSVPGSSTTATLSTNFEWGLQSASGTGTDFWQSNKFDNSDLLDHFVTYRVTGLAGGPRWLLAVEDLPQGISDFDYNDWVGEIDVVPLPGAAGLGLAGLGALVGARAMRRR